MHFPVKFDQRQLQQLYRYCLALTQQADDAFDLLQNSLEKFLRRDDQTIDHPKAYMKQIIRTTYIDQYRKKGREACEPFDENALDVHDADLHPLEQTMIEQSELEYIWACLNDAERELLYLWAVEGYSMSEMSRFLGVPRGMLLARLHRMRIRITQNQRTPRQRGGGL